jgi:hypothetical protein
MFANIRSLFSALAHAFQATAAALTQLSKTIAAFLDEHKEHFGATSADYLDHSLRISRFSPFLTLMACVQTNCLEESNEAYPSTIHWLTGVVEHDKLTWILGSNIIHWIARLVECDHLTTWILAAIHWLACLVEQAKLSRISICFARLPTTNHANNTGMPSSHTFILNTHATLYGAALILSPTFIWS